jgi:hypothetical protein
MNEKRWLINYPIQLAIRIALSENIFMKPLAVDSIGNSLPYRIIGAAMAVHNQLGFGYKKEVYERA